MSRNPRLIYARMTGWGQSGALAQTAGHDINYISLAGALAAIGTRERPVPPLNLVGDYAGGSLYLIVGVLAALHEARQSGHGQVVDAAITDGVINLMAHFLAQSQRGSFQERRESNMLDGGVPWYGVYATADGRYMSVGAIEPQFFSVFVDRLGLDEGCKSAQFERERWLALRQAIADAFLSRTRAQWEQVFADSDACVAPVLALSEAMSHRHNLDRANFVSVDGVVHPAAAPRFSRTPSRPASAPPSQVTDIDQVRRRWSGEPAGFEGSGNGR